MGVAVVPQSGFVAFVAVVDSARVVGVAEESVAAAQVVVVVAAAQVVVVVAAAAQVVVGVAADSAVPSDIAAEPPGDSVIKTLSSSIDS